MLSFDVEIQCDERDRVCLGCSVSIVEIDATAYGSMGELCPACVPDFVEPDDEIDVDIRDVGGEG